MPKPWWYGHHKAARPKGFAAEHYACTYLQKHGFELITQNYHCLRGEIDLIMQQRASNLLIFTEVKWRTSNQFGEASEQVTHKKQQKIIACAEDFLHHHPIFNAYNCRFDILAISPGCESLTVNWLPAAFTL